MKIKLLWLRLVNFKGAKHREIAFHENCELIGPNRSGKSTSFDAWTWLLFGKNSEDAKDFAVQPLDELGNKIDRLAIEVSAGVQIDDITYELKRIQSEKWVKRRGSATEVFDGNETSFFKNGVKISKGDFDGFISTILPELIFKMVSSVGYFPSLPWQQKREILFKMAGEVTDADIIQTRAEFKALAEKVSNLVTIKKELAAKKKMLKSQIEQIPARIEENLRSKPEPVDVQAISAQIDQHKAAIEVIDTQIADANKALEAINNQYAERLQLIADKRQKANAIATAVRQDLFEKQTAHNKLFNEARMKVSKIKSDIDSRKESVQASVKQIERLTADMNALRVKIDALNAATPDFSTIQESCPSCKQSIPQGMVDSAKETIRTNFLADKKIKIDRINEDGVRMSAEVDRLQMLGVQETEIIVVLEKNYVDEVSELDKLSDTHSTTADDILKVNEQYVALHNEVKELEAMGTPAAPDHSQLTIEKARLNELIFRLQAKLKDAEAIEKIDQRIKELQDENLSASQAIADIEREEMLIAQFEKAKVEATNDRINAMFRKVTVKMFRTLVNGGEEPCCDILVDGVPYDAGNLNTGDRIIAGLDIIETLSKYYKVFPPVFVDNAESVDPDRLIAPHGCQMIALVRSDASKMLEVVDRSAHALMA